MKKLMVMLLSLALIMGALAGCGKKDPAGTKDNGKGDGAKIEDGTGDAKSETPLRLQWHQGIGIDTLFESPAKDLQSLYPYMIFDSLMMWDASNTELVPSIAAKWTNNEDYTEFTVTIRDGVKWHDGEAMDVNDVAFSVNYYVANPNSSYAHFYQYVEGYEALRNGEADSLFGMSVDGNVITFKLSQAQALFLNNLSGTYILPEHLLGDMEWADIDSSDYWTKPIGTGAFKIDKVKFPDYFTAVRNEEYWGEPAGIKNVEFVSYQAGGNDAAVAATINGEIDFATPKLVTDKTVADNMTGQNGDLKTLIMNDYYIRCFTFNLGKRADGNEKKDLQKKEVRQAFDLLIDQETIASFFGGQATASATLINPVGTEYNTDIPYVSKDVKAAKKLLDEAGFDYSSTIDIAYYYDDQTTHDIMSLIVQDFAEAGVKVNTILLSGDLSTLIYTDCNYDLIYLAGGSAAIDQANYYSKCTSWTSYTMMGQVEERTALFDELMNAYNGTADEEERKELAWELQARNYEYAYLLPAYILNNCVVYNTASVEIPEEAFEVSGGTYYRWQDWKMLK